MAASNSQHQPGQLAEPAGQQPAQQSAAARMLDSAARPVYDFAFSDFLAREFRFGLDTDRPICKAFVQGHCPLNEKCPDKHYTRSNYNNLICKHWLRGLCKKGNACEFLHEYNLREMPECIPYARYMNCSNGSECLYLHLDPSIKQPPCEWYERGFCPLGPHCGARHVKKARMCRYYMAGFCPNGKDCDQGAHPVWKEKDQMKKPEVKIVLSEEEKERERERLLAQMEKDAEEDERRYVDRPTYNQQKMQGRGRGRKGWTRQRRDNRF